MPAKRTSEAVLRPVGNGAKKVERKRPMTNPFATTTLLGLLLFGMITVAAWAPQDTVVVAPLLR
jgi:hypothetical protein